MFKTGHICSQPDALYLALDIYRSFFFQGYACRGNY